MVVSREGIAHLGVEVGTGNTEGDPCLQDLSVLHPSDPAKARSSSTGVEAQTLPSTASSSGSIIPLTAKALMEHDIATSIETEKQLEINRIAKLRDAARELGFYLPGKCFAGERWQ
ncbi:hypothetical protein BDV96DRAFT_602084 [Lophiotrema nucula]|uniref:Uncharacterized protein n=1 Tax=Lophiotrema nucula TaxID=690887 RepID=A0A6A5Z1G7_9PLEO|nr:hypothetical protein BDV96DRAFT_602084 [Lophiotrema nucula]